MLAVQEQKLALDLKQADISLRELDHNQKLADKSIEAQAEDRKDERMVNKTMHLHTLFFAAFVSALAIAFILAALYMGKDALVLDLVKVIFGFAGGWGVSTAMQNRKKPDQD